MQLAEQSHPQPNELAQYNLGKLSDEDTAAIEEHVAQCEECARTVVGMPGDTFLDLLRRKETSGTQATELRGPADLRKPELQPEARDQATTPQLGGVTKLSEEAIRRVLELPAELRHHSRYQIQECLGVGGMGTVYRAQHRIMNRPVALKVINPQLLNHPGAVERFEREVQAAARLSHSNIVTAHDADHAAGLHFLVMEFVDGVDLHHVIKERGPLSADEACEYIRQAALGLQHAHQQGMVHRDIKPHNLMLVTQKSEGRGQKSEVGSQAAPVIKILDFGLASFASDMAAEELNEGGAASAGSSAQLTMLGSMMGTPDYIAPEQASDAHSVDIRADVYSLGCTFYCLLAGRAPFHEGTVFDKIRAHSEQDAAPLAAIRNDVPAEVEAVVRKMMAKDPSDRYQTPQEVVDALTRLIDARIDERLRQHGIGEPPTPLKPRTVGDADRRPVSIGQLAGLACLGLALVAGVVIYLATNDGTLIIETADPRVQISVNQQGKRIRIVGDERAKEPQQVKLRVGEYELKIIDSPSEMVLSENKVIIRRGGEQIVRVRYVPKGGTADSAEEDLKALSATAPIDIAKLLNDSVLALDFAKEHFYEKSGESWVRDLSGRGNDMLCEQAKFSAEGPNKNSVSLSAKGSLKLPRRLIASGKPFTVAAWVHRDLSWDQGDPLVFAQCNANATSELSCGLGMIDGLWMLNVVSAEAIVHHPFGESRASAEKARNFARWGNWGFVAWTRDAEGKLSFTVNGQTQQTSHSDLGEEESHNQVDIGRGLDGGIDELAVFNRDLSPTELRLLYAWGKVGRAFSEASQGRAQASADPNAPSRFFQSLGDLRSIVRKTVTDAGLSVSRMDNTQLANSGGPRSAVILKLELSGEQDRGGKILSAFRDKFKSLSSQTGAFISSLDDELQDGVHATNLPYTAEGREGLIRVDVEKTGADKREIKIGKWSLSLKLEEWPASVANSAKNNAQLVVGLLQKEGRYVLDGEPVDDLVEFMNRLKLQLKDNPSREVLIECDEKHGVALVKQVVNLIEQLGGTGVRWPQWVKRGDRLGTYTDDGTMPLVATMPGHTGSIIDLAWSSDGKWIASASHDNTVLIWDAHLQKIVATLVHREQLAAVTFSPDSRWLVTGTVDAEIKIRELEPVAGKGATETTLPEELLRLHDLAFSPNGEYLLCCGAGAGDKRKFAAYRQKAPKDRWDSNMSIQYEDKTPLRKLVVWPGVPGFVTAVSDKGEAVTWNYIEGKGRPEDDHAPANLDYKTGVAIGLLGDGHLQVVGNAAGELLVPADATNASKHSLLLRGNWVP